MTGLSPDPERAQRQLTALAEGRRPFSPPALGNVRALRHAGYAEVATSPLAGLWSERFFDQLSGDSPLREDETWRTFVAVASKAFARLESVGRWLDLRETDLNGRGVHAAMELERRLRSECAEHLERLRMAPFSASEDALVDFIEELERRIDVALRQKAAGPVLADVVDVVPQEVLDAPEAE